MLKAAQGKQALDPDLVRLSDWIERRTGDARPPSPAEAEVLVDAGRRLLALAARGRAVAEGTAARRGLIGESPALRALLALLERIAPRDSHVLIEGESGTGKELVARALHRASPRAPAPFVAVDCGALPDSLLESELFGHRRGAFTGALADRAGLIEAADGGTLFLDELANASPAFQTRLLRVLQEREVRRVGENRARGVDLRVVAATSGDLRHLIAAGRFRGDLYYRLNVITIDLPPLRHRREDVPPLVEHFLGRACGRHGLAPRRLSEAALEILCRYPWPGNVRELENVVERLVLLSIGTEIAAADLPGPLLDALLVTPAEPAGDGASKSGEQRMIELALLASDGDRTRAARAIGWPRTKLYRRLQRYGIPSGFGRARAAYCSGASRSAQSR